MSINIYRQCYVTFKNFLIKRIRRLISVSLNFRQTINKPFRTSVFVSSKMKQTHTFFVLKVQFKALHQPIITLKSFSTVFISF